MYIQPPLEGGSSAERKQGSRTERHCTNVSSIAPSDRAWPALASARGSLASPLAAPTSPYFLRIASSSSRVAALCRPRLLLLPTLHLAYVGRLVGEHTINQSLSRLLSVAQASSLA